MGIYGKINYFYCLKPPLFSLHLCVYNHFYFVTLHVFPVFLRPDKEISGLLYQLMSTCGFWLGWVVNYGNLSQTRPLGALGFP